MLKSVKNKISIAIILLSLEGCSLIPSWISEPTKYAFSDFTTYFNIYYNAKKFYNDAEVEIRKQENLLLKTNLQNHKYELPVLTTITQVALQKLETAIAKSSKILSLYSTTSFVDDALLLIGKSYYLQNDYYKAERKFQELFATSKDEEIIEEGKLYLAKTYRKQKLFDKANSILDELVKLNSGNYEAEINFELGYLNQQNGVEKVATNYFVKSLEQFDDEMYLPYLYFSLGDLEKRNLNSEGARKYFSEAASLEDPQYKFLAEYEILLLLPEKEKIAELNELLKNQLYKNYFDVVEYDIAQTNFNNKNYDEAFRLFKKIDTVYTNSEVYGKSKYQQGLYFENVKNDYQKAVENYKLASISKLSDIEKKQITEKYTSLNFYVQAKDEILKYEKEISVKDSLYKASPDSIKNIYSTAIDSIQNIIAMQNYELAVFFYTKKNNIDSANYYLNKITGNSIKPDLKATSIYMLSIISKSNKVKQDSLYNILINDYPESKFAFKIREESNIKSIKEESPLIKAENYLSSKNYYKAKEVYDSIINNSKSEEEKSKAMLALGYIYENYLVKSDSAKIFYEKYINTNPDNKLSKKYKLKITNPEITKPDSAIKK